MAAPPSLRIAKAAGIVLVVIAAGLGWWMLGTPAPVQVSAAPMSEPVQAPQAHGPSAATGPRALRLPAPGSPQQASGKDGSSGPLEPDPALPEDVPSAEADPISHIVRERGTHLFDCLRADAPYGIESLRVRMSMVPVAEGERIVYEPDLSVEMVDDALPAPPEELLESTLDCLEDEVAGWSLPATADAEESVILFGGPPSHDDEDP